MGEVRINVYVTMSQDQLDRWVDDASLEETFKAVLHELIADDQSVVVPHVMGIDVEVDHA